MSEELKALSVDTEVDARGTACPGPLLEAKRAIADCPEDGIMCILSSDEGTIIDVQRWCKKMGHEYLGDYEDDGYWRVFMKKIEE
ncbi:MAG: sulfurtransferase TusA family protein [Pontiellaceae bacterium]|nr:sulfurtransferase TusA family protein [Pontiellaceae bacterium]MBN2784712.1 sulfurtransferase TusA family protein [Pontiellaceae bacterium]